ncbi:MAG: hypothetical protein EOO87_19510 [Pedobacter sp.]|nr:MAG: hypothetical protein EOO87_19510 [Pedobacter sp.]
MRYFLTAFFLPLLLCSTFAQTNFKINGNIKNIPGVKDVLKDGDTVILSFSALHLSFPGIIKNNAFSINENIIEPAVAMLEFKGSAVKLLVDNSIYNVEIVNKEVRKGFYTYEGSVTTNSEFHNGWYKFAQSIFALYNQKTKLVNELDSVKNDIAKQNVNQKIVALDTLINFSYKKLAQTQPNNPASAYLMGSAPDFSYTNYIDAYKNLSFKVRNGFFH